jgi:CDP-diacylglycerol--serine O-phosphatidyltransferase
LLFAGLMLTEIPMFSFKFKSWGWAGNEIRIIFAAMATALLLIWQLAALALVVLLYIGISCFIHYSKRKPLL